MVSSNITLIWNLYLSLSHFSPVAPLSVRVEGVGAWVIGGQETTFRCRVEGAFPPPTVRWTLGGKRLQRNKPLVSK